MHDIERLCNRIIIIDDGKIFFDGDKQRLYTEYEKYKILKITTHHIQKIENSIRNKILKDAIIDIQEDGEFCRILFDSEKISAHEMIEKIQKERIFEYEAMSIEKINIEDIVGMILSSA